MELVNRNYYKDSESNMSYICVCVFYRCTVHFDIYKVHTPTNALFIKLDKVLKFTLKITSTCSYMFRSLSTTIIRESSLKPSLIYIRLRFGKKKLRRYTLCGGVAACHRYGVCTVLCVECMV